jgi:hypothetical protein
VTSSAGRSTRDPTELRRSITAYAALMLYLVAVKVTLSVMAADPGFRSPTQTAVFAWPALAIVTAAGLIGVFLSHQLGLPGVWSPTIPLSRRLTIPAIAGLVTGLLAIAIDRMTGWSATSAAAMGLPSIHIAWPSSLVIYPGGAIVVNVIYYLVPIPVLVWLITRLGRDRVRFDTAYWIGATLAALIEPVSQGMGNGLTGKPAALVVFGAQDFAANLAQVYAFRRAGFGAAVVFRVGFYLVWHVVNGLTGA